MLTIGTSAFGCLTPAGKSILVEEQVEILLRTLAVRQSGAKEQCWRRKIHVETDEPEAGIEVRALVTIIDDNSAPWRKCADPWSTYFTLLHRVSIVVDMK